MSSKKCQEQCCVIKCTNTSSNRNVKFFSFLEGRLRPCQREKWLQAIQKENGQGWSPIKNTSICSEHFVQGRPSKMPQDTDYVPTIFKDKKTEDGIKSRPVSLKRFALEYMKHEDLLETPSRANANTKRRKAAYVRLAAALGVPVATARSWEQRFRKHVEKKLADPDHKKASSTDGTPHWLTTVEKKLYSNHMHRVLAALCAAARSRRLLCGAPLYNDVRRKLRLAGAVSDLHAVWVSAQRVSLEQVRAAGRAGDAAPPPNQEVADLVLLHTDVDVNRLLTDESVTLYEESSALHTLWQLVQQHRLEDDAGPRLRAQRWTRAYRDYKHSGRYASIVVLQRRWHELKLQARERLAAHWRRSATPVSPAPPAPHPTPHKLNPAPHTLDPAPHTLNPAPPNVDPAPSTLDNAPHELSPRPMPLHISILKRYPHVATGPFKCWRELVQADLIVLEPLKNIDMTDTQSQESEVPSVRKLAVNDPAGAHLYPNLSKVEHEVNDTVKTGNVLLKHCLMNHIDKQDRRLLTGQRKVSHPKEDDLLTPKTKDFEYKSNISNDLLVARSSVRQCFEDNSNDEIVPKTENCSDLDTENNLVIPEFSNMPPCFKQEAVTETHSVDTVSTHGTLEDTAPTIEVLNTIDPSTVKKEIVFESDEDDFQPCDDYDKVGIKLEEEAPRLSNRIMFADEEPERCDVTDRVECWNEMEDDSEGDTPAIDPKLLMDTTVPLFRIDKTRAWRNNVRKDKSIRVSRIHRRYYTPKRKPNTCLTQETGTRKSCLNKTQEIRVDNSCLEKVANTHSIKQLCMNIKREMIDELEDCATPNKKIKLESDSEENEPLTVLRKKKNAVKKMADEREEGMCVTQARYTIEDSVPRRVTLPQRRAAWSTRDTRVAQVAPITSVSTRVSASGENVATPLPVVATHHDSPAWRPLDLPADHELKAALDDLALAASVEQERRGRQHCCAARRQREVNDTRRRLGLPPIKLHTHEEDACTCCCAHLSDVFARRRLSAQLRALHHDIERMLCKTAEGTDNSKPKNSRSPSPAQMKKPISKYSSSVVKSKRPNAKSTNQRKQTKKERKCRPDTPPAPPLNDYEEWQRQKNLNAQYFHINGNISTKKDKSIQSTAGETATTQSIQQKSDTQQSTPQNVTQQNVTQQNVTQQNITQQNVTSKSITPRYAVQPSVTQQIITPQNVNQSVVKQSNVTPSKSSLSLPKPRSKKKNIVKPASPTSTTTTEQPTPPLGVTHEPSQPVSLLEEYSRTLSAPPGSVNALALHVPGDTRPSNTTIVMAVTLPSNAVIHDIGLKAKNAVDLTNNVPDSVENQKKTSSVLDFVGAVKNLMVPVDINACKQKLLQRLHHDAGRSLLKNNNKKAAPSIMSLCKPLRHGDVIEVEDSDSDEGTKCNDSPIGVNQSENLAVNPSPAIKGPSGLNETFFKAAPIADGLNEMSPRVNTKNIANEAETSKNNTLNETETNKTKNNSMKAVANNTNISSIENETNNTQNNSNEVETVNTQNKTTNEVKSTNEAENSISQNNSNQAASIAEVSINQAATNSTREESCEKVMAVKDEQSVVVSESCKEIIAVQDSEQSVVVSDSCQEVIAVEDSEQSVVVSKSCQEVITVKDEQSVVVSESCKEIIAVQDSEQSVVVSDSCQEVIAVKNEQSVAISESCQEVIAVKNEQSVAISESCDKVIAIQDEQSVVVSDSNEEVITVKDEQSVSISKSCQEVITVKNEQSVAISESCPEVIAVEDSEQSVVVSDSSEEVIAVEDSEQSPAPLLPPPTNMSARCRCRRADVAALPRFMRELRLATQRAHEENYIYKIGAIHVAAGALPCGGTLLCVDGTRAPLALRGHLLLAGERPCGLPTYWTLQSYSRVKRVVPHETAACHTLAGSDMPADVAAVAADRGLSPLNIRLADNLGLVCEKKHKFQVLTALTSVQDVRGAVQSGERLLLLHRQHGRMFALVVRRHTSRGSVRYRAIANVDPLLLKELEAMLNDAEMDEELRVLLREQRRRLSLNSTSHAGRTDGTVSSIKEPSLSPR